MNPEKPPVLTATPEATTPQPRSFESLVSEIERITASLERGDLPLDQALSAFERANLLATEAQALLAAANARLTKLVSTGDKGVAEVPFELPESSADATRPR